MNKKILVVFILLCIALLSAITLNNESTIADTFKNLFIGQEADKTEYSAFVELGKDLKDEISFDEGEQVIFSVNGEFVTLNEWKYNKVFEDGKSKNFGIKSLSAEQMMDELIERKMLISEAKRLRVYPSSKEVAAYVKEQAAFLKEPQLMAVLQGWEISEEQYLEFLSPIWADSIAISNWEKTVIEAQPHFDNSKPWDAYKEEYDKLYQSEITKLEASLQIEMTGLGRELGL